MWKHFTRNFRETVEKKINVCKRKQTLPEDCRRTQESSIERHPLVCNALRKATCNTAVGGYDKDPSNAGESPWVQKRGHQGNKFNERGCIYYSSWLGALGWSSALVLGWCLSQPLCWRRTLPGNTDGNPLQSRNKKYVSLTQLITKVALNQPGQNVLPKAYTIASSTDTEFRQETRCREETSDSCYGPLTAEQALDEAAEDFAKAQSSLQAGIENRQGVQCIQQRQHKDAIAHFQSAADLNDAAAAFNLGLCYEKGLGAPQDLKMAAKLYHKASSQGHAQALYNLGVFHVHGWGGVPVDYLRARQLFQVAAEKGQVDAINALDMIKPVQPVQSKIGPQSPPYLHDALLFHVLGVGNADTVSQESSLLVERIAHDDSFEDPDRVFINANVVNASSVNSYKANLCALFGDTMKKYGSIFE